MRWRLSVCTLLQLDEGGPVLLHAVGAVLPEVELRLNPNRVAPEGQYGDDGYVSWVKVVIGRNRLRTESVLPTSGSSHIPSRGRRRISAAIRCRRERYSKTKRQRLLANGRRTACRCADPVWLLRPAGSLADLSILNGLQVIERHKGSCTGFDF